MDPKLDWSKWFAVALPVSAVSIVLIWLLLLVSYKPSRSPDGECDLEIKPIRPTRDPFTLKQYWVCFVCLATIGLWCFEHAIEDWVGDMGVIAIIPIVAFFSTGVLKKASGQTAVARLWLTDLLGRFRSIPLDSGFPRHGRYLTRQRRHLQRFARCSRRCHPRYHRWQVAVYRCSRAVDHCAGEFFYPQHSLQNLSIAV